MLTVGRDDLVIGGQAEPGEDDVAAVRRRGRQRKALDGNADGGGELRPDLVAQCERSLEVGWAAAALLEVSALLCGHRLDRRQRERPVRARVQVREALEDRELGARLVNGHSIVVSTGA